MRGLRASCDACMGVPKDAIGVARSQVRSVFLAVGKASACGSRVRRVMASVSVFTSGIPVWLECIILCALVLRLVAGAAVVAVARVSAVSVVGHGNCRLVVVACAGVGCFAACVVTARWSAACIVYPRYASL